MEKTSPTFDYIKYDQTSLERQAHIKEACMDLEHAISACVIDQRANALCKTKLEELYAWAGKGIRNDQVKRNGSAELQESRNNS